MTTKLQSAVDQHQAARAVLARLLSALEAANTNAAGIDERIANGAGIDDPGLFGQRRNLADLAAWLASEIAGARRTAAAAEEIERETRDAIRGTRRELDALLARAGEGASAAAELLASAERSGDYGALALLDTRQRLQERHAQLLLDRLAELGEDPA